jgi:RNA polymerase sigma factor (TIGR02999 family)
MAVDSGEVTLLLKAMKSGDESAADRLLPLVYQELHRLAAAYMRNERPDHTLQPTALINEAYLRLAGDAADFQNHAHFFGVAANVMRHLLVDHARARNAGMRGGGLQRVELDEWAAVTKETSVEVLAIDEALKELEKIHPRQARIVELRYFSGLPMAEVAAVLNISPRSAERDWTAARVWLYERIR